MTTKRTMRWALIVLSLSVWAAAQDTSSQDTSQDKSQDKSQEQPSTTPAPAFGQNAPILNPENPPISGLDAPSLELRTANRSFIAPALQASQTVNSNGGNRFGGGGVEGITRLLGALDLQRFWSKSDLLAEYLGGIGYYSRDQRVRQIQALGIEAITRWRTGQATVRDAFNYLPEGAFSLGFGDPGLGLTSGRIGGAEGLPGFTNSSNGSVGLISRIANTAALDIVQSTSPRSAFTVAGAFGNSHYFDNTLNLINSDQTTAQAGYSHLLNRRDQIAAIYGFQLFHFPQGAGGRLANQIFNLRWGHTISGRMSLVVGAGPQYNTIQLPGVADIKRWSVNGRVQLRYRLVRTSLSVGYEKYVSSGSGFFAGADTQRVHFSVRRELERNLELITNVGYSHNKSLQPFSGVGVVGSRYDEGFAGAILRKHIGRTYDLFASYHFAEIGFDDASPLCGLPGAGSCANTSQRHAGTVGVEWHPTPKRIE